MRKTSDARRADSGANLNGRFWGLSGRAASGWFAACLLKGAEDRIAEVPHPDGAHPTGWHRADVEHLSAYPGSRSGDYYHGVSQKMDLHAGQT
jgi:hypothetical protein